LIAPSLDDSAKSQQTQTVKSTRTVPHIAPDTTHTLRHSRRKYDARGLLRGVRIRLFLGSSLPSDFASESHRPRNGPTSLHRLCRVTTNITSRHRTTSHIQQTKTRTNAVQLRNVTRTLPCRQPATILASIQPTF